MGAGVDSSALLSKVSLSVNPGKILILHTNYGQKARTAEWDACLEQAEYYNIPRENCIQLHLDLTYATCGIMPSTVLDTSVANNNVLELRNPLLILLASSYLSTTYPGRNHAIYVGLHKEPDDTSFKDAVAELYIKNLNTLILSTLSNPNTGIHIKTPFSNLTRREILEDLIIERGNYFVEHKVHSCYEQEKCGICTHCVWLNSNMESFLNLYKKGIA